MGWVIVDFGMVGSVFFLLWQFVMPFRSFRGHSDLRSTFGMAIPKSTTTHHIPTLGTEPLTGTTPERRLECLVEHPL